MHISPNLHNIKYLRFHKWSINKDSKIVFEEFLEQNKSVNVEMLDLRVFYKEDLFDFVNKFSQLIKLIFIDIISSKCLRDNDNGDLAAASAKCTKLKAINLNLMNLFIYFQELDKILNFLIHNFLN